MDSTSHLARLSALRTITAKQERLYRVVLLRNRALYVATTLAALLFASNHQVILAAIALGSTIVSAYTLAATVETDMACWVRKLVDRETAVSALVNETTAFWAPFLHAWRN